MTVLDELEPVTMASAEAGQPVGDTPAPEAAEVVPMTLEQLTLAHPGLVEEVRAEARREYMAAHPQPAAGTRAIIDAARVQGADQERTRILAIYGHVEARGREDIALKLCGMPSMTVNVAAPLMASIPRVAQGPAAEFSRMMEELHASSPAPDEDDIGALLMRMQKYQAVLSAEAMAQRAKARPFEG